VRVFGSLMAPMAACAVLMLAGCAAVPPAKPPSKSSAASLRPLVPPATLGGERTVNQVVRGAFGAREITFNCVVTVKDGAMTLVGLDSLGVRLFTIRYDGKAIQSETTPALQSPFMPERLIADMQLVFWPLTSLAQPMRESGWQVTEAAPGVRRLRHGEQLISEVHYSGGDPWSGRSWLVNFEYDYSLQIDSQAL
jgi:hypothetical protein